MRVSTFYFWYVVTVLTVALLAVWLLPPRAPGSMPWTPLPYIVGWCCFSPYGKRCECPHGHMTRKDAQACARKHRWPVKNTRYVRYPRPPEK